MFASLRRLLRSWLGVVEPEPARVVTFMQGGYTYEIFCRGEEAVRRLNDRLALDGHLRR